MKVQLRYIQAKNLNNKTERYYGVDWEVGQKGELTKELSDELAQVYINSDRVFEIIEKKPKIKQRKKVEEIKKEEVFDVNQDPIG